MCQYQAFISSCFLEKPTRGCGLRKNQNSKHSLSSYGRYFGLPTKRNSPNDSENIKWNIQKFFCEKHHYLTIYFYDQVCFLLRCLRKGFNGATQPPYFPWFASSEQEKNCTYLFVCLFVSSSAMLSSKSLLTGSVEVDLSGSRNF